METENNKFDSIINLMKEANENKSRIKNKINIQIEEINKTNKIINQFEECLKQQNEMLNKLLDENLAISNYKSDLIKELRKLENNDDEVCGRNVHDNQGEDDSFVKINSANIDTRNDDYKNSYENYLDNRRDIEYDERNIIELNTPVNNKLEELPNKIVDIHEDRCQTNLHMLANNDYEPIKVDYESSATHNKLLILSNNQSIKNDNFVPSQKNKKLKSLKSKIKIPENEDSIFNEDFIKNYSPKLMFRLESDIVVAMDNVHSFLYACCEKGILLMFNKKTNTWKRKYTGNSKTILLYKLINFTQYLFCENEFIMFSKLNAEVKVFDSNIISNFHTPCKKSPFCYISLENGEIWKYDLINNKYNKIFSFHSKMKACINLPNESSLFLTEDGKVFTTSYRHYDRIPELDGCVDILDSSREIVVCCLENAICKVYNTINKKMFDLKIYDSIKFARHSGSVLAVLDVQNRLHLYKCTKKTFQYEEIQVIQIPTTKNISAMSNVINKQIFINVENEIYLIQYN